jgi:hypothetical protein
MTKRITDIIIIDIAVFNIPGIVELAFKNAYSKNTFLVWILTIGLAILLSILNLLPNKDSSWSRTLRNIRFFIFKTRNIAILLILQLALILATALLNPLSELDIKSVMLSFGIDLLTLNLMVAVGKIPNADKEQLLLHNPNDGKVYLQTNAGLKYIPDPETFDLLGLNWYELIDITNEELRTYKMNAPVTSAKDMKLINYRGRIYGIVNDKLKHVPNVATLQYILNLRENKDIEGRDTIKGFEIEKPFAKMP